MNFIQSSLLQSVAISIVVGAVSCSTSEPLTGPKAGGSPGYVVSDESDCARIIAGLEQAKSNLTQASQAYVGRKFVVSTTMTSLNSYYPITTKQTWDGTGCTSESCEPVITDSTGKSVTLKSTTQSAPSMSMEQCEALHYKIISEESTDKKVTVNAGTFLSHCVSLEYSISGEISQEAAMSGSSKFTNCYGIEPKQQGLPVLYDLSSKSTVTISSDKPSAVEFKFHSELYSIEK